MDVLYLKNDILDYNLHYMESDFMCNPGPMAIQFLCVQNTSLQNQLGKITNAKP